MSESQHPFTDREVRAILARAAELQVEQASGNEGAGTTLSQLQQAASELGIDPGIVQQAATEVAANMTIGSGSWILGGPWRVDSDRILAGRVTAKNWPAIVEDMRAKTGRVGFPKDSGELFEWTSNQPDRLHISISPSGANSRVRVTGRFGVYPFIGYYLGASLGMLAGCMLALANSTAPVITAGVLAGSTALGFLTVRLGVIPFAKVRNRQMRELTAFLEERIGRPESSTNLSSDAPILAEHVQMIGKSK